MRYCGNPQGGLKQGAEGEKDISAVNCGSRPGSPEPYLDEFPGTERNLINFEAVWLRECWEA